MIRIDARRIGTVAAFVLLGALGSALVALVTTNLLQPVQEPVYRLLYLRIGPSEATETAILTHFLVSGIVAVSVPTLLGAWTANRLANVRAFALALGGFFGLLGAFLVAALLGLASLLTAFLVIVLGSAGVPLVLRYHLGVHSGGVLVFLGGVPVLLLLVFAAGFGLGWGWGYDVTAQEVPEETVNESATVTFESAPAVRDDLFSTDNCETTDTGRECRLPLRGYEREGEAARLLAQSDVRCPFQNSWSAETAGAAIVEHDGRYYRVQCSSHGD
jgi:hypothetical protein